MPGDARHAGALRIDVLGPLRLQVDGEDVRVPGGRRRAVLALLAIAAPAPITTDRLVDTVWPDDAPASGRAALQSHVSRIRGHLGRYADRVVHTGFGYRLDVEEHEVDARQAAAMFEDARAAAPSDPHRAIELLTDLRALHRGPPLEDLTDVGALAGWTSALTERWIDASSLLLECSLATGEDATAVDIAAELAEAAPLNEDVVTLRVRSLARQGRAADAMRVAHDFRRHLVEETGLEPSRALSVLEAEVASGLDTDLPSAPGSSGAALPTGGPTLVGRDAELDGVARLLRTERLVTVVGPGGIGKTQLTIEAARRARFPGEVTLVRLEPVTDGDGVAEALARAAGLRADAGDLLERCALRLGAAPHLLVVDNCEHVLEPVRRLVAFLLDSCPELTVLATSRERLVVSGEQTLRLAPLALPDPDDPEAALRSASLRLFVDRARAVRSDFTLGPADVAAAVRLIRALDGLPLAIELAAGRVGSMTIHDMAARLDRALDLLAIGPATPGGSGDGRHRTLRAAIGWSYDLLDEHEQRLFRHLAVFADGFDLATAESVASDLGTPGEPVAALAHLVDASMVVAELGGVARYRMLDSLRRFALDRLDAGGERTAAEARLRRWAVSLARWFDDVTLTEDEPVADARLRRELGNLAAAWSSARVHEDLDTAVELVVRLYASLAWRDVAELWRWALELADDERLDDHPRRAAALAVASEATWFSTGDLDRAEMLARLADEVAGDDEEGRSLSLWALGDVALFRGRYHEAGRLAIEARVGTRWAAEGWVQAALAAAYAGDTTGARELLATARPLLCCPTLRAWARYAEGEVEGVDGNWALAESAYREVIDITDRTGADFIHGVASVGLVSALTERGALDDALVGFRALIDRWERSGAWTQQWTTLRNLADLLERIGDPSTADDLRAAADASPEAPAISQRPSPVVAAQTSVDRAAVLAGARSAIDRALAGP